MVDSNMNIVMQVTFFFSFCVMNFLFIELIFIVLFLSGYIISINPKNSVKTYTQTVQYKPSQLVADWKINKFEQQQCFHVIIVMQM